MRRDKLRWYVWFGSIESKPVKVDAVNRDGAEIAASAKTNLRRADIVRAKHVGKVKNLNKPRNAVSRSRRTRPFWRRDIVEPQVSHRPTY